MKKFVFLLLLLGGCASGDSSYSPYSQAAAIKGQGGVYKIGNPYKIMGQYYVPQEDYSYSEVGMASWYGKDFHAKKTANGEDYDMNTLTAAHRTLPLPSIVKVTNLENGRSLVLRVNDRGPFVKNRIIDISKRGAQLLGFMEQGTAKVRVDILPDESKALKAALTGEPAATTATASRDVGSTYVPSASQHTGDGYLIGATANDLKSRTYVQAGSFKQSATAQDLGAKLSSVNDVTVVQADVSGERFYRVRLGPFSSEAEATKALDKVRSMGVYSARIIHE